MSSSKVVVLKTSVDGVLEDYKRLLRLLEYQKYISREKDTLIKLNLSWTKYFPACSSQPWQLEGLVGALIEDGFRPEKLFPVENKTVVTDPIRGAKNNRWSSVFEKYGLKFNSLPKAEWVKYEFRGNLVKLRELFPEGIEIPKIFIGKQIIHLPTLKTHGHSITTGAVKNAFGGLLKEARHYAHKYIHEVLAELMIMQRELHPGILAVMDATVCGDGAGPRTMLPVIKNYILGSSDSVALDAVAARMMGFTPLQIPYIRLCQEMGLGTGDPKEIEIIGEDISGVNFGFRAKKSFVIWGDQMLRLGFLRFLENIALKSPLAFWAPIASNFYHDFLWYPIIGRIRINRFKKTEWGRLFESY